MLIHDFVLDNIWDSWFSSLPPFHLFFFFLFLCFVPLKIGMERVYQRMRCGVSVRFRYCGFNSLCFRWTAVWVVNVMLLDLGSLFYSFVMGMV